MIRIFFCILIWDKYKRKYSINHLSGWWKSSSLKKIYLNNISIFKSIHPEVFLEKTVPKICSKLLGEHPCRSAISIKLLRKFIEIILSYGCSPVNLLHIFRTPFPKYTSGRVNIFMTGLAIVSLGKPIDSHWLKMSCLNCLVFRCVYCFFLKRWNYVKTFVLHE